MNMNTDDHQ